MHPGGRSSAFALFKWHVIVGAVVVVVVKHGYLITKWRLSDGL